MTQRRLVISYFGALLASLVLFLVATPVGSGDSDLWYHLNGGRLMLEQGQIPDSSFFSFIDPERSWVNYFWGFQTLAYAIHRIGGYEALIVLRAALVLVTFLAISALLWPREDSPRHHLWTLVLLGVIAVTLVTRAEQIRPHLVSYAMIAVFLYILERRHAWLPVLPALTLLWINLHGVEWPVGALICGGYFLHAAWSWRRGGDDKPAQRRVMVWTAACLPAILINPFGTGMLTAPFRTPADIYEYILELHPIAPSILLSFNVSLTRLPIDSALSLLFVGTLLAYVVLISQRRFDPVPILLSVAGFYLMSRGARFAWEWMLLSLPLWRLAIASLPTSGWHRPSAGLPYLLLAILFVLPVSTLLKDATAHEHWPLNADKLPVGSTTFLSRQGAEGNFLIPPNMGGYIAWKVYPDILISADMQTPPTIPWDHFRNDATVISVAALKRFAEEFSPSLIGVELASKHFRKLIGVLPQYRPVMFDDQLVIYADAEQLPGLVKAFELHHVNPFNLLDDSAGSLDERLEELRRVHKNDQVGDRVQHALVRLLFDAARYREALPLAQGFADSRPINTNSHYLLGNLYENLNRFDEARERYLIALDGAPEDFKRTLHRHLGSVAYLDQDLPLAYRHFEKAIQNYVRMEDPQTLFQYALSAAAVGDIHRARTVLQQLLYLLPADDQTMQRKAESLLNDL